jgi:hypothetical protein
VFADAGNSARERDAADPLPGFLCGMASGGIEMQMIGGWAPGRNVGMMEDGLAMKIAAGTTLVYQVHYHNTTGAEQPDRSGMALYLTRETVHKHPRSVPIGAFNLNIAAGDPNSEHTASWTAPANVHIRSIMPHMHYIGKDMKLTAAFPDGSERVLLDVPRYDFNWQTSYIFTDRWRCRRAPSSRWCRITTTPPPIRASSSIRRATSTSAKPPTRRCRSRSPRSCSTTRS